MTDAEMHRDPVACIFIGPRPVSGSGDCPKSVSGAG